MQNSRLGNRPARVFRFRSRFAALARFPKRLGHLLLTLLMVVGLIQAAPPAAWAAAITAPAPLASSYTVTANPAGGYFYVAGWNNPTWTFSASTTAGHVILGNVFNGATGLPVNLVGLPQGGSAQVTVTGSDGTNTYSTPAITITSTDAVPSYSGACNPTISSLGGYRNYLFTASTRNCIWTVPTGVTAATNVVVIGGGGAGGTNGNAGTGGAGAVLVASNYPLTPGATMNFTIGAGGGPTGGVGKNGTNTIFDAAGANTIAVGGGGAAGGTTFGNNPYFRNGMPGGSGGAATSESGTGTGGSSTALSDCNCSSSTWTGYGNSGASATSGAIGYHGGGASSAGVGATGGAGLTLTTLNASGFSGFTPAIVGASGGNVSNAGYGGNVGGYGTDGSIIIQVPLPAQAPLYVTSTSGTYGTSLPMTSTGGSSAIAVAYTVTNGTATGCTLTTGTGPLTATSAGTCIVTATKGGDASYSAVSSAPTTVTFAQIGITVTASAIAAVYGAATADATPTAATFATGDTFANSFSTQPTCTTTYVSGQNAGTTYTNTCSGGVSNKYSVTSYASKTLTVAAITLTAPTISSVVATPLTLKSFDVTWNTVPNATSYEIGVGPNSFSNSIAYTLLNVPAGQGTTQTATFSNSSLVNGSTYYVFVRAVGSGNYGTSQYSAGGTATTKTSYQVTYNASGTGVTGSVPLATSAAVGADQTIAGNTNNTPLVKTGYIFAGWATTANATTVAYRPGDTYNGVAITLYSVWTIASFSVTYSASGGTGTLPTQADVTYLGSFIAGSGSGISYSGYTFNGWCVPTNTAPSAGSACTGTTLAVGATYTFTSAAAITVYALWSQNSYFYSGSGATGTAPTAQPYLVGITARANTFTAPTGYAFSGWCLTATVLGSSCSGTLYPAGAVLPPPATATSYLYAVWSPVTVSVTYASTGQTGSVPTQAPTVFGGSITIAGAGSMTYAGKTLTGWTYNAATYHAGDAFTIAATGTITFTAVWTANSYVYNASGASGTVPTAQSYTGVAIVASTPSSLTVPTGYAFGGWCTVTLAMGATCSSVGGTPYLAGASLPADPGAAPKNLYAVWTASLIGVTFTSNNATSGVVPTQAATAYNTSFTLPTAGTLLRTGYTFGGWLNGSTTYQPNSSFTINSASTITFSAVWTANTYVYNGGAASGSAPPTQVYTGSLLSAPANTFTVPTGYSFGGWCTVSTTLGGACTGGTVYQAASNLPAPGAAIVNLYAIWTALNIGIFYDGNGAASGTAPTQPSTAFNTGFSLPGKGNLANAGYTFAGWSYGGSTYQPGDPFTVAVTSSITFSAIWTANTYVYNANGAAGTDPVSQTYAGTQLQAQANSYAVPVGHFFGGWCLVSIAPGSACSTPYAAGASLPAPSSLTTNLYAVWSLQTMAVTYLANGATGTVPTQADTAFSTSFNLPALGNLAKLGYTFAGWSNSGTIYQVNDPFAITAVGAISFTANWTPNRYVYDGNSFSGPAPADQVYADAVLTAQGNTFTVTSGYTFGGWCLVRPAVGSGCVTVYAQNDNLPTPSSLNTTLYAAWNAISYPVTYDANSGAGTLPLNSTAKYNTNFLVAPGAGLNQPGYVFIGWRDNIAGTGTLYPAGANYLMPLNGVTLYAQYGPGTYVVSYGANNGTGSPARSGVSVSSDSYTTNGTPITLPDVGTLAKTGYDFAGWSTSAGGTALSGSFTTAANVILYAVWAPKPVSVTYLPGVATSLVSFPNPASSVGHFGDSIVLASGVDPVTTISNASYGFVGWSDGSAIYPAGATYKLGLANVNFTAIWVQVYGVRYVMSGGTAHAGEGATDAECVVPGSLCTNGQSIQVNLAPSRSGYTFANWQDQNGNAIAAGASINVSSTNYILTAVWTPVNYQVTYDSLGGATTPTDTDKHIGDSVTLAAGTTKAGYTFGGWSNGGFTYAPGASYSVGAASVTFAAVWNPNTYVINYDWSGGLGSATAADSYVTGHAGIPLPTAGDHVKDGYIFMGWSLPGSVTLLSGPFSTLTDVTLVAVWGAGTFTLNFDPKGGTLAGTTSLVPLGTSLSLPTPNRSNYVFTGWYTSAVGGQKVGDASTSYTPIASLGMFAHWTQTSIYGIPDNMMTELGTVNASQSVDSSFSGSIRSSNSVTVNVPAGALPDRNKVTIYKVDDYNQAASIVSGSRYVLSVVVAWQNVDDGSVVATAAGKPLSITIVDPAIRIGASVYSVLGSTVTFLGKATANGTVTASVPTDPQINILDTPPDAPTNVTATDGGNHVSTISWTAPASDGGAAITGYTVTSSGGQTCTTTGATSCVVSGLTNGTSYTFTVTATNSVGTSASSAASGSVTPHDLPTPTVSWNPVSSHVMDDSGLILSGASSTGDGAITYSVSGAGATGCAIDATTNALTFTGPGSCVVTATAAATGNYQTAALDKTFVITSIATTISVSPTRSLDLTALNVTVTIAGGNGTGTYTLTVAAGTAAGCQINNSTNLTGLSAGPQSITISATAPGTCVISVTRTNDPVPSTATVNFNIEQKLAAPTSVVVSATSGTLKSLDISWAAVSHAAGYLVTVFSGSTVVGTSGTITGNSYTYASAGLSDGTSYSVVVTAIGDGSLYSDSSASSGASVTTNTAPSAPASNTVSIDHPNRTVGQAANLTANATGNGILSYQWLKAGTPISGATSATYRIGSVTLTDAGDYSVIVTDSLNGATSVATSTVATLAVAANATFTSPNSPALTVGINYSFTPSVVGGAPSLTYSIASGALPTGVRLDQATGVISGVPTAAGTYTATVQVTDANGVVTAGSSVTYTVASGTQAAFSFTADKSTATYTATGYSTTLTFTPAGGSGGGAVSYVLAGSGSGATSCSLALTNGVYTLTAASSGTCVIEATKASDADYNVAIASFTFTFEKAVATVTASSPVVHFGDAIPAIAGTVSGLLGSDTAAAISGLTCSTTYTSTSAAGSPQSTLCSGATAANYTFSFTAGAVTVLSASTTVTPSVYTTTPTYGSTVTFHAAVPMAGAVTFSVAGIAICSAVAADASSPASCDWTPTGGGSFTLSATFTPSDFSNYASATATVGFSVAAKVLTLTNVVVIDKTYNGNTVGQVVAGARLVGVLPGEVVTVALTPITVTFGDPNVGTNKPVTITGYAITGADAGKYILLQPTGITGNITLASTYVTAGVLLARTYGSAVTITGFAPSRVGTIAFLVDNVAVSQCATVANDGIHAATCSWMPTSAGNHNFGVSFTPSSTNYAVSTDVLTIPISKLALTITGITAVSKPYDGTTTATVSGTAALAGVVTGDMVTLGGTPTFNFSDYSLGVNKSVIATGYTIGGTSVGNYSIAQPTNLTADITPITTTSSAVTTPVTPTYGTDVTFTITESTSGALHVTIDGNAICVGLTYSGSAVTCTWTPTSAGNHTLSVALLPANSNYGGNTLTQTFTVGAKVLTVTGLTGVNKPYDGGTAATVSGTPVLNGVVSGDAVTLGGSPVYQFADAAAGTGKPITASGFTISGTSASNYTLTQPTGLTANITGASTTPSISVATASPTYGTDVVFSVGASQPGTMSVTVDGVSVCTGIPVSGSAGSCTWTPNHAGTHIALVTFVPTSTNYSGSSGSVTFTVSAKAITVTAIVTPTSLPYGSATVPVKSFTTAGLVGNDQISSVSYTYSSTNSATAPTSVGVYTLSPSAAVFSTGQAGDYNIIYNAATYRVSTGAALATITTSTGTNATYNTPVVVSVAVSQPGTVSVYIDGVSQCSNLSSANGLVTCNWTPAAAGSATITADLIPSDAGYSSATAAPLVVTVARASQSISFTAPSAKTWGDAPFAVTAVASSGLVVNLNSQTTGICTFVNGTVTALHSGTCVISATQAGDSNFLAAGTSSTSIAINALPLLWALSPIASTPAGVRRTIHVTWNLDANATDYLVRVYSASNVLLATEPAVSGSSLDLTSANLAGISDNTSYRITVQKIAVADAVNSTESVAVSARTNSVANITYLGNSSNTGTAPAVQTFVEGASPLALSTNSGNLARTGYAFVGWNTAAAGSATDYLADGTATYSTTTDLTLYAKWTANALSVTFNSNWGTATTATQLYVADQAQNLASNAFNRTGYQFVGWATSPNGAVVYADLVSLTILVPVTLYAVWSSIDYHVSYLLNGGTGSAPTEATHNIGDSFSIAAIGAVSRTGYSFGGWTDGTNVFQPGAGYLVGASDINLTAIWNIQHYTITYNVNGASSGSPSRSSDDFVYGSLPIALPTVGTMTNVGYAFGGWSATVGGPAISGLYSAASSVTLRAVWLPNTYTITYNPNGAIGALDRSTDSYTTGTAGVTLPTVGGLVRAGYTFAGWATSANGTALTGSFTTAANVTLFSVWNPTSYTVSYDLVGGTGSASEGNHIIGDRFALAVAPNLSGYYFAGWNDGASTYQAGYSYLVGASDVTLLAVWVQIFYVHYNFNGSSAAAPADNPQLDQAVVSAIAAPLRAGYTFGGWRDQSGAVIAAGRNFTVGASHFILNAEWIAIQRTVSYQTDGGFTAPTENAHILGDTFSVASSLSRPGYTFDGWNDGSHLYGAGATYSVGLANIEFTAQWAAIQYGVTYDIASGTAGQPANGTAIIGSNLTLAAAPLRHGYQFAGWRVGGSTLAAGAGYLMSAAPVTFTATWFAVVNPVTYVLAGATGAVPTETPRAIGDSFSLAAEPVWANHDFLGWSDGSTIYRAGSSYLDQGDPVTFTAQWANSVATVQFAAGAGQGAVPVAISSIVGQSVTLPGPGGLGRTGYVFGGWTDGTSVFTAGQSYSVNAISATLTAIWNAAPAAHSQGGGSSNSGAPSGASISTNVPMSVTYGGKAQQLTATTAAGSPASWSANSSVCRVSPDGQLVTLKAGDCELTVTDSTSQATKTVTVKVEPRLELAFVGVTNLTSSSATVAASVQWPGTDYTVKFCVTTSIESTECVATSSVAVTDQGSGGVAADGALTLARNLSGLKPNTQYFVRAAVITSGESYLTTVVKMVTTSGQTVYRQLKSAHQTLVNWSTLGLTGSVQVLLDGKLVGQTSANSFIIGSLVGPKRRVELIPVSTDGTQALPIEVLYLPTTRPIPFTQFSYLRGLTVPSAKSTLRLVNAVKALYAQGFDKFYVGSKWAKGSGNVMQIRRTHYLFRLLKRAMAMKQVQIVMAKRGRHLRAAISNGELSSSHRVQMLGIY